MNRDTFIANLEALVAAGKDGPAVRFGLGKACLERPDPAAARSHLERAVALDPSYSAAWKLLGKACTEEGDTTAAADAYRRGIAAATAERRPPGREGDGGVPAPPRTRRAFRRAFGVADPPPPGPREPAQDPEAMRPQDEGVARGTTEWPLRSVPKSTLVSVDDDD